MNDIHFMTNKETNAYLAERLFGLSKWIDDHSDVYIALHGEVWVDVNAVEYIANFALVLEKISANLLNTATIRLYTIAQAPIAGSGDPLYTFGCAIDGVWDDIGEKTFFAESQFLGEAVCRAAVEYLKGKKE